MIQQEMNILDQTKCTQTHWNQNSTVSSWRQLTKCSKGFSNSINFPVVKSIKKHDSMDKPGEYFNRKFDNRKAKQMRNCVKTDQIMQMPSNWISTNSNSVPLSEAVKEKIKISKRRRKMNRFKHFRRSERWIPDLWASYTPFLHNQAFLPRDLSLPYQEISELIAATRLQWQRASHSGSSPLVHWALGLYSQHNKPIWPNDPMALGLSDGNWILTNLWNIPLHNWPTYSPSVK